MVAFLVPNVVAYECLAVLADGYQKWPVTWLKSLDVISFEKILWANRKHLAGESVRLDLKLYGSTWGTIFEEFVMFVISSWKKHVTFFFQNHLGSMSNWYIWIQYHDTKNKNKTKQKTLQSKLAWTITKLRDKAMFLETAPQGNNKQEPCL